MYTKQLPSLDAIQRAADLAGPFPVSAGNIITQAERAGLGRDVVDFLRQFPLNEIFQSQTDFMTRCEELEVLIRQELDTPQERLRSPQD